MNNLWTWLITSSQNPAATSLAVKGVLIGALPILITVAGLFGFPLDAIGNDVIEGVVTLVNGALTVVAAIVTLIGLFRKVQNGRWSASQ